jgi:hypothetical protein
LASGLCACTPKAQPAQDPRHKRALRDAGDDGRALHAGSLGRLALSRRQRGGQHDARHGFTHNRAMTSQLDQLRDLSAVVADTGDIEAIARFRPLDATTNPSLLLKAAALPAYAPLIDAAIDESRGDDADARIADAGDRLAVAIGGEILRLIPARVSTECDARYSFDTAATLAQARKLVALYEAAGIGRERLLIKIAATWEGIRAAAQPGTRRHPLQPHPAVLLRAGGGMRRSRRLPDLALRRAASSTGTSRKVCRRRPCRRTIPASSR